MPALAASARSHLTPPQLIEEVFEQQGGVFQRILTLASAMRALNPDLGPYLRAYRRRVGDDASASQPYRLVFTDSHGDEAPELVISNTSNVDFMDAMDQFFGPLDAKTERQMLTTRLRVVNGQMEAGGRLTDAAMQDAFFGGHMDAPVERGVGQGVTYAITDSFLVPSDAFLESPDLSNRVLLTAPAADASMDDPIVRLRARFAQVRATLSRPFDEATPAAREEVIKTIAALNRMSEDGSFEETMHHGWVGFAQAQGLQAKKHLGWTSFLIHQAQASPYAFYGDLSPMALATAANDGPAVQDLLRAGVSPSTVMSGWPDVFDGLTQRSISDLGGQHIPIVVYAAAVGSLSAMGSLLQGGADPNHATDTHETALHRAAALGDDALVRMLLQAGASAATMNRQGNRPEDLVPEDRLRPEANRRLDSLNRLLCDKANAEMQEVNRRLDAEVAPLQAPEPAAPARELWNSHRGPGRR